MSRTAEPPLRRRVGLLATAAIAIGPAAVVATALRFDGELTERLPVWWRLDQTVAATADTTVVAAGCAAIGVVATVLAVGVSVAGGRWGFHSQRVMLVGLGALSGFVSGLWWTDMGLVLDAGVLADPRAIAAPTWDLWWPLIWLAMLALAVVLVCGSPPTTTVDRPPDPSLPRVQLPDDEPVVWRCDLIAVGFGGLAGVMCVLGASSYLANPAVAAFCCLLAVVSAGFARTRIEIDESGVRLTPWGLPLRRLATYDVIVDARVEIVLPLRWRGRGYHVLPGAAGWIPRTRLGLVLSFADGRRYGIAMDQAEVAAGIINSMLDRRRRVDAMERDLP
jgi:hypothetical protein